MSDIRSHGYALITALIFLIVLTLVAIIAIRVTGLEIKMSANNVMRTEAFEASETSRTSLGPLLDAHVFSRGWPTSLYGSDVSGDGVPDALFDFDVPAGFTIGTTGSGGSVEPRNWYDSNSEADATPSYVFNPNTALDEDASYSRDVGSADAPYQVSASLAVYKLRADINPGSGAAMVSGYEGLGKAAAAAGGNVFFFIRSEGRDSATEARYVTGAVYRHVITN